MTTRDLHAFRLTIPRAEARLTSIELDGQPLRGVTAVSFHVDMDHQAVLTLQLYADIEFSGEADVIKEWRRALGDCEIAGVHSHHFNGRHSLPKVPA